MALSKNGADEKCQRRQTMEFSCAVCSCHYEVNESVKDKKRKSLWVLLEAELGCAACRKYIKNTMLWLNTFRVDLLPLAVDVIIILGKIDTTVPSDHRIVRWFVASASARAVSSFRNGEQFWLHSTFTDQSNLAALSMNDYSLSGGKAVECLTGVDHLQFPLPLWAADFFEAIFSFFLTTLRCIISMRLVIAIYHPIIFEHFNGLCSCFSPIQRINFQNTQMLRVSPFRKWFCCHFPHASRLKQCQLRPRGIQFPFQLISLCIFASLTTHSSSIRFDVKFETFFIMCELCECVDADTSVESRLLRKTHRINLFLCEILSHNAKTRDSNIIHDMTEYWAGREDDAPSFPHRTYHGKLRSHTRWKGMRMTYHIRIMINPSHGWWHQSECVPYAMLGLAVIFP